MYKKTLQEQAKQLSRFTKNSASITSGLVFNQKAKTDREGILNQHYGIKNKPHHNFGGKVNP